jgi:hypothetical protein
MAWRIHQGVSKGEIDNRQRDHVHGQFWLVGRDSPIRLDLSGNCRRDLAGCLVKFENPTASATPEEYFDIAAVQNGAAGDITASRKVRVFDVPLEEALRLTKAGKTAPEHMGNCFYLEWFSEANGRVVIESTDYKIDISTPVWRLSPDEEQKQIDTVHQAMRDWLDRLDESLHESREEFDPDEERPLDEFGYEKFMRESDARTDKYMKLLEKYEGHPEQEKIVAREMGWTWLEEALEADERGAIPPREEIEVPELIANPSTEGVDWIRDESGHIRHPLTKRAFESATAMWHFCDDRGLLGENGDTDLHEMIFQFQTAGAKIAGALNSLAYGDDFREGGFIVAALKRALKYLHASVAAAEKVGDKNLVDPEKLKSFRTDLFEVREEILGLMKRFREDRG